MVVGVTSTPTTESRLSGSVTYIIKVEAGIEGIRRTTPPSCVQ